MTDPDVVHGQARTSGTRIPVSVVLGCLAAGLSEGEILRQYPTLTVDGIRAAAAYGAALALRETVTGGQRWRWHVVADDDGGTVPLWDPGDP